MGYQLTEFSSEVDSEFCCTICMMVLEDPVSTLCDHLFCYNCICRWLSSKGMCPVDREPQTIEDLKGASKYFLKQLYKLEKKCDFYLQGCHETYQLQYMIYHKGCCTYNPLTEIVCDKGCNLKMGKSEFATHNCITHLSARVRDLVKQIRKQDDTIKGLENLEQEQRQENENVINSLKLYLNGLADKMNRHRTLRTQ